MLLNILQMKLKQSFFNYLNNNKYIILSWLIVLVVLVVVIILGLDLHKEVNTDIKNNTPTNMTDSTLYLLFSVVALIITQIANPIHQKRYKKTINYIQSIDQSFTQHTDDILKRLSDTESTIKFYIVERNISTSLHKIIVDAIVYLPTSNSNGILELGTTITNFALNINDFGINNYNNKQLDINVSELICNTNKIIEGNYPQIAKTVKPLLLTKIKEYKAKISLISTDSVFNSKMDRFRTLSEMFLQEYLTIVITTYLNH